MAIKLSQLFLRALTEISESRSSSILRKNSNQPTIIRRLSSFGVLGTRSNSLTLFPVMLQSVPTRKFINLATPILARGMQYSENRTISYSVEQIFSIVANVDQYHQFVPWCKRSKVIKRRNGYVQAELEIGFPPIIERYVSDVTVIPNHQVRVTFEFKSLLHSQLATVFFDEVVKQMVKAFEIRAAKLYGRPQETGSRRSAA